ncbi:MAG: hypothetical protein ABFE13_26385 [Phycisphaerales bacterium]
MNRWMMAMCVLVVVAPMVFAVCPEQPFLSLDDLDPNRVATDPASGEKLVFKRLAGWTGQMILVDGRVCDPDNEEPNALPQELKVWRQEGAGLTELAVDPNGLWQFTVSYTSDGWHYETVSATDGIAVRTGTIAIRTRTNRPPSLCGGQP